MKEQFHIVLITLALFVGGLLMGIWTQRTRPIPAPPAQVFGELQPQVIMRHGGPAPGAGFFQFRDQRFGPGHAEFEAQMSGRLAEMEPKIKEFQTAFDSIENQFVEKVDKLLTPDQKKKFDEMRAEEAPATIGSGPLPAPPPPMAISGFAGGPGPGGEGPRVIARAPMLPPGGWLMMSIVIYQPSLGHLTKELSLDSTQQAAIKQLMIDRRTEFLALVDKSPPPTLSFGDLP